MSDASLRYSTLDGMRGVAALLVVVFHLGVKLGHQQAPEGYLAVDLFFALSGFVMALSYADRLAAGMPWHAFMKRRLIRLYPLYALGALMGIALFLWALLRHQPQSLPPLDLLTASLFSLLALPTPPAITPFIPSPLFPFNGPSWSLFFEIVVNLLFAAGLFRLGARWLIALCAAAAVYLLFRVGSPLWFNGGSAWSDADLGIARTLYAFPAGMLLWRAMPSGRGRAGWLAIAAIAVIPCLLCAPVSDSWRTPFELGAAILAFPALLAWGVRCETPRLTRPLFFFLGDISYAVYAVHWPLIGEFIYLCRKGHLSDGMISVAFLACILPIGFVAHHLFDIPARRILSRWLA